MITNRFYFKISGDSKKVVERIQTRFKVAFHHSNTYAIDSTFDHVWVLHVINLLLPRSQIISLNIAD